MKSALTLWANLEAARDDSSLCAANGIDWASISQMAHVNDQWYHIKKSILLFLVRFVPFGPVSRRTTLP